jgi:hypothetical protein
VTAIARPLQMPERTTERLNLALIRIFLAFEVLEHFLNVFHIVECFPQRYDEVADLFECLLD